MTNCDSSTACLVVGSIKDSNDRAFDSMCADFWARDFDKLKMAFFNCELDVYDPISQTVYWIDLDEDKRVHGAYSYNATPEWCLCAFDEDHSAMALSNEAINTVPHKEFGFTWLENDSDVVEFILTLLKNKAFIANRNDMRELYAHGLTSFLRFN